MRGGLTESNRPHR